MKGKMQSAQIGRFLAARLINDRSLLKSFIVDLLALLIRSLLISTWLDLLCSDLPPADYGIVYLGEKQKPANDA